MATISTDILLKEDPLKPVQPVDNTDYGSITNEAISSIPQLQDEVNSAQNEQDNIISQLTSSLQNTPSYSQLTTQAEGEANVEGLQQSYQKSSADLNNTNAQISALGRQAQAIPLQIQQGAIGQGMTDRGVQPLQTAALRENSIRALTLASQADVQSAVAKNDYNAYTSAVEKSQRVVDLKYKDQQIQNETALKNLEVISTYKLSPKQQQLAEAKKIQVQIEQERIKAKIEDEKAVSDMIVQASINGADQEKLNLAKNAKTRADAAIILGEYAGDYYKNELLREQIKGERAKNKQLGIETDAMMQELGLVPDSATSINHVLDAIALGESAGRGDYDARGPVVTKGMYKGESALGRYQVMPGNLPQWSEEALGRVVTPEEFMKNPGLQDQIVVYQFKKNYDKYGNWEDAASVWFTGKPVGKGDSMTDDLGTTGSSYVQKFRNNLASVIGYTGSSTSGSKYTSSAEAIIKGQAKIENFDAKDRIKILNEKARIEKERIANGELPNDLNNLVEKLKKVDSIYNNEYLKTAVGPNTLARVSLSNFKTGGKDSFLADVSNLINTDVIDTLISAKANGATFGALSEEELRLIKQSASKISGLAKTNKAGDIIGYKGSEKDFKIELEKLRTSTEQALLKAGVPQEIIDSQTNSEISERKNKFSTGLGVAQNKIGGTSIISNMKPDGSINFSIPQ